ncbi:MAG: ATP-binding domain-containing protein, partial [Alphaproteobacteria bacterium]|nr:ATP-binding domain-containing protein [Alphaproteobacteria bacterium]
GRLENLKELVRAMEAFENLAGFLEHVALVVDNAEEQNEDMVNLMTLHAAKGLEFETVFLPGWEEGVFPHPRALEENGIAGLEEERRLAYVGITRARRRCHISFAANRRIYNQWQATIPSRFVEELPEEHVTRLAEPGLWGSGRASERGMNETSPFGGFVYGSPWLNPSRPRRGIEIEGKARRLDEDAEAGELPVGSRIFHQKFGYGRILHSDGGKLEIEFEKAGRKKVLASFVEPA